MEIPYLLIFLSSYLLIFLSSSHITIILTFPPINLSPSIPLFLQMPMMPPKQGKESKGESYNPILSLPAKSDAFNAEALDDMPMTHSCSRCGSIAVGHMPGMSMSMSMFEV